MRHGERLEKYYKWNGSSFEEIKSEEKTPEKEWTADQAREKLKIFGKLAFYRAEEGQNACEIDGKFFYHGSHIEPEGLVAGSPEEALLDLFEKLTKPGVTLDFNGKNYEWNGDDFVVKGEKAMEIVTGNGDSNPNTQQRDKIIYTTSGV